MNMKRGFAVVGSLCLAASMCLAVSASNGADSEDKAEKLADVVAVSSVSGTEMMEMEPGNINLKNLGDENIFFSVVAGDADLEEYEGDIVVTPATGDTKDMTFKVAVDENGNAYLMDENGNRIDIDDSFATANFDSELK